MSDLSITNQVDIHQHTYWNPINHFLLAEDTYPNWNVFCIEDGIFEYQVVDQKGKASFGDIIICPPHLPLRRKAVSPLKFHFLRFSFNEDAENKSLPIGKINIKDERRVSSTYSYLRTMAYSESPLHNEWKAHLLSDLLTLYYMENHKDLPYNDHSKINDPLIQKAVNHLHKHAFSNITIRNVASDFGLSPVQFTRRFQSSIGVNPIEYLTSLRIRKVRTLLLETNDTLEEIASRCGYSNGFYMSRMFSKKMKMSPSQFRRTHRI